MSFTSVSEKQVLLTWKLVQNLAVKCHDCAWWFQFHFKYNLFGVIYITNKSTGNGKLWSTCQEWSKSEHLIFKTFRNILFRSAVQSISSGWNEIFAQHGLAYRRQQWISKSMMLMEIKNGYLQFSSFLTLILSSLWKSSHRSLVHSEYKHI